MFDVYCHGHHYRINQSMYRLYVTSMAETKRAQIEILAPTAMFKETFDQATEVIPAGCYVTQISQLRTLTYRLSEVRSKQFAAAQPPTAI
jgi:hypothetical protein